MERKEQYNGGRPVISVGIIGVNGYAGGELLRLLSAHPKVKIRAVASRSRSGEKPGELFPIFRGHRYDEELEVVQPDSSLFEECDLVFLAVPHGVSARMVPGFLGKGIKVIDLGADFRFHRLEVYEDWYKVKHDCPQLLSEAVYGLPELNRERLPGARLVGNPGCYPTSILLGIAPLLKSGLLSSEMIIADSKSGVSGAGRSSKAELHYAEAEGDLRAYGIGGAHRHIPEIEEIATELAGKEVKLSFTPHLAPMVRGIFSTIYLETEEQVTESEITGVFQEFYRDEPFVTVLPVPILPQVKAVVYSNHCHLGARLDRRTNRIIVCSVLDNMVKGAAGQAIQNMNIVFGWEETTGLPSSGIWP